MVIARVNQPQLDCSCKVVIFTMANAETFVMSRKKRNTRNYYRNRRYINSGEEIILIRVRCTGVWSRTKKK